MRTRLTGISNYYTLAALVREIDSDLAGSRVEACYAQSRGELTIAVSGGQERSEATLRIGLRSPELFLILQSGHNRARRNTVAVFEDLTGCVIDRFEMASGDRQVTAWLSHEDGKPATRLILEMFGSRANAYLVDDSGVVLDRFRDSGTNVGEPAPNPRESRALSLDFFSTRLAESDGPAQKRIAKVIPSISREIAAEIAYRAGEGAATGDLYSIATGLIAELETPHPRAYYLSDRPITMALTSLTYLKEEAPELEERMFPSVNEAVATFLRHVLAQKSYSAAHDPLESALKKRIDRITRTLVRMTEELEKPSRADMYERFGHILMALQTNVPIGSEEAVLDDVITGEGKVTIPLDPELSAVRNAERYYVKARKTRKAREASTGRLDGLRKELAGLEEVGRALGEAGSRKEIEELRKRFSSELSALAANSSSDGNQAGYRRFILANGYEVWVGRNAAENDRLTTRDSASHDFWLHARGVPGSHTVLRVPRRTEKPPASILYTAAAIAAWFSKARTSELAPVICTRKKYVRKPRKSLPGSVRVEREEVLLVKPGLPVIAD